MFERVTIRASDPEASERFYATVLEVLGFGRSGARWADFEVAAADDDHPVTCGLHIGFVAQSRALVDDFWRVGTGAGYRSDGEPGPRPEYGDNYYGGFLLDPDGISAEAVHNDSLREGGAVDHLWIRVADVPASKAFYERIGAAAGFHLQADMPLRAQFMGESGSFSVLAGEPTRNVELAFHTHGDASEHLDPDGNRVVLTNDGSRPVPLT